MSQEMNATTLSRSRKDMHTISLLVANKPGVLLRIALVFSRRGFNVESLVVSPAKDGRFARMTITAQGDPNALEQIVKQVDKLIDVLHAQEHVPGDAIEREMALVKVEVSKDRRNDLIVIINHFKGVTADISHDFVIIQVTGTTEKLDALIEMLSEFTILEVVRSGKLLITRQPA